MLTVHRTLFFPLVSLCCARRLSETDFTTPVWDPNNTSWLLTLYSLRARGETHKHSNTLRQIRGSLLMCEGCGVAPVEAVVQKRTSWWSHGPLTARQKHYREPWASISQEQILRSRDHVSLYTADHYGTDTNTWVFVMWLVIQNMLEMCVKQRVLPQALCLQLYNAMMTEPTDGDWTHVHEISHFLFSAKQVWRLPSCPKLTFQLACKGFSY